jgi:hypothetical protein
MVDVGDEERIRFGNGISLESMKNTHEQCRQRYTMNFAQHT